MNTGKRIPATLTAILAILALTAGFTRPQAGSIMDAEQSDELAEAYEQGKQAVFDAMNHFDELAIVERANPYRKYGR